MQKLQHVQYHCQSKLLKKLQLYVRFDHRRLCTVKNMLAMYLNYHKAGLTPTTPVTSIAISSVKMSIGCKSLTNLRSEMIFLQRKPVFYTFLPSTSPTKLTDNLPIFVEKDNSVAAKAKVGHVTSFRLSVILRFYHI